MREQFEGQLRFADLARLRQAMGDAAFAAAYDAGRALSEGVAIALALERPAAISDGQGAWAEEHADFDHGVGRLLALVRGLSGSLRLDDALDAIVQATCEVARVERVAVWVLEGDALALRLFVGRERAR